MVKSRFIISDSITARKEKSNKKEKMVLKENIII
jgi:hypothetical protein